MGHGSWSAGDWSRYAASSVDGRSRAEIFGARGMKPAYDPATIARRESVDSADNPASTPVIIGVDVTGSMGSLAEELIVRGLNTTFTELLARRPVSDPHVMAMAIGDASCDAAPLQVTHLKPTSASPSSLPICGWRAAVVAIVARATRSLTPLPA